MKKVSPDGEEEYLGLRRRRLRLSHRMRLRSGRLVADVRLPDGRNLAWTQVSEGWAAVRGGELEGRQLTLFREAEARAREDARGVWSQCDGNFRSDVDDGGGWVFE